VIYYVCGMGEIHKNTSSEIPVVSAPSKTEI
jgi:hypothetical protein